MNGCSGNDCSPASHFSLNKALNFDEGQKKLNLGYILVVDSRLFNALERTELKILRY